MQCSEIQNYFADYLKEGLDASTLAEFSQHLKECPACRAELETLTDVWVKLGSVPSGETASLDMRVRFRNSVEEYKQALNSTPFWKRRTALVSVAAAVLMVLVSAVILRMPFRESSAHAVVESVDGTLSRSWGGQTDSMHAADSIRLGDVLRSDGGSASLALTDGSRIEMRAQSELFLESADDGIRIRLKSGGVIVNAAKQRSGHLYVQTKDFTVSVVGTVFFVNAEETGSRVAVIEGEVHVQQGATTRKLRSGEQVATNPGMESQTVGPEISWSRHAEAHMALLEQSTVQTPPAPKRLEFEAASVRSHLFSGSRDGQHQPGVTRSPGRITFQATSAGKLIEFAFGLPGFQIDGRPDWLYQESYDVVATSPPASLADQKLMLQTLLAERFGLSVRHSSNEGLTYALIPGKKLNLKEAKEGDASELVRFDQKVTFNPDGGAVLVDTGKHVSMSDLAVWLSSRVGHPVMDKTGIEGVFDIEISEPPLPTTRGVIYNTGGEEFISAVQRQLGLSLEPQRGPVETLLIEHVQKPSEN